MSPRRQSRRKAADGKPVIEVEVVTLPDSELRLTGTAVTFEGTVRFAVYEGDVCIERGHLQATAGGPQRGDWQVRIRPPPRATHVVIAPAAMEETPEEIATAEQIIVSLPVGEA